VERAVCDTLAMARYHHDVYAKSTTPRYSVIFDLQWQIIECQRLDPSTDLRLTMTGTIDRLSKEGRQPEKHAPIRIRLSKPQRHPSTIDLD
jgi:hypothetical protein